MVHRYRHVYLLASLLLLIGLGPFVERQVLQLVLLDLLLVVVMATSAAAIATTRLERAAGAILAVGVTVLLVRYRLEGSPPGSYALPLTSLLFFGFMTVLLTRHVFARTARVTTDTICGSLSVYLLLGVLWAFAYAALEELVPGSFRLPADTAQSAASLLRHLIGFSFITLTTVGYGNIAPVSDRAYALCSLEAVTGQIYLTVLVARLVALHITHSSRARGGR